MRNGISLWARTGPAWLDRAGRCWARQGVAGRREAGSGGAMQGEGFFMEQKSHLRRAAEIAREFIGSLPYSDEGRQVHEILVEAIAQDEERADERISKA